MQRFVEIGHPVVGAIDGEAILDQIVGANAEEVRVFGKEVRRHRSGGHLNHHANGDRRHRYPLGAESFGRADDRATRGAQLFQSRYEREHDAQRPMRRGSKQCPELRLEHVFHRETQPDAAQAERRSRALGSGVVERELRLADLERPDRHPPGRHAFDEPGIRVELDGFGERRVTAAGQQELGSEQADAVRPRLPRPGRIVWRLNIGLEADLDPVLGYWRQPAVLVQRLLIGLASLLTAADVIQFGGIGIDEDIAGGAVHGEPGARRDDGRGVTEARDCRT